MKILVAVKRVVDHNVRVQVAAGGGVDVAGVKMAMNPFDEVALEAAVRLREAGHAREVVAVGVGPADCQETLRTALALGADRAVLIHTADLAAHELQPLAVARLLHVVVVQEAATLVIAGKQAIDDDAAQTGPMLAALLGWPQATCVSRFDIADGRVRAVCEIEGGQETRELVLPALLTVDLRLNEPRYATLANIMKARKLPIDTLEATALGVDVRPHLATLRIAAPPLRRGGVRVSGVADLVARLRHEAKVIR